MDLNLYGALSRLAPLSARDSYACSTTRIGDQMVGFSKDEMRHELRTILSHEADHVRLGAGEDAAAAFMGFRPSRQWYVDKEMYGVDLGRFAVTDLLDRAYDFAFAPTVLMPFEEHELARLTLFMRGIPRFDDEDAREPRPRFMTPNGLCQTVCDAARARWNLDRAKRKDPFSLRDLALLANMTEGAVRNALAVQGDGRLHAIPNAKPVSIAFDEGKRWLHNRRGFVPTPRSLAEDPKAAARLAAIQTAEELGEFLGQCVRTLEIGTMTGAPKSLREWYAGTFTFDIETARWIAEKFGFDVEVFVQKAVLVSLRREATAA